MASPASTCWTLIRGAVAGRRADREEFARRYLPVARAYLCSRWEGTPLIQGVEDAVQEVFLDFLREEGALDRFDEASPGGFRPFFYGVLRNVARHVETRAARTRGRGQPGEVDVELIVSRERSLSTLFDRVWALSLVEQAVERHAASASQEGAEALRRVDLLRLRFQEGLPIRDIAARWGEDAARMHKQYARARREFRRHLHDVVAEHGPADPAEVERRLAELLAALR